MSMFETLTLDQLRLFLCVAEEGSFSAAARQLHRVQSSVSYGISNLEEILGVQLFDRNGHRPQLTRAGRVLLLDARQIFEQIGQFRACAASIAKGLEPDVSFVVDAIFPAENLVEIYRVFQAQFPTVSLRIHTEVLGAVASLVLDGTCQLGISGPVGAEAPGLRRRFVTNVAIVPVAESGHPLARIDGRIPTAEVRDQVQIVISQRSKAPGGDRGVLSGVTWRVADAATKLALIRAGLGWGNLPLTMVRNDLKEGVLVRLTLEEWGPQPLLAPLCSIVRADAPPGPAGQWLLQHLDTLCQGCDGLESPGTG